MSILNIAMAQINPLVGDITGNCAKISETVKQAQQECKVDIVVFPELTLTGYPPEDLLLRPSLEFRVNSAIQGLCEQSFSVYVVIGYPKKVNGKLYNMAGVIHSGRVICEYAKQCLPNYQVFDEKRYFSEGSEVGFFSINELKIGLSICEDIWDGGPIEDLKALGVDLLLNLNGSPFHQDKQKEREVLVSHSAQSLCAPIVYVNQVGGQDELVFDGGSMACDATGKIVCRSPLFEEVIQYVAFDGVTKTLLPKHESRALSESKGGLATVYDALVLGVRDYINKNRFSGAVLGLSGGIDSALTLAIAVDAIGADKVEAVMMPFRYTSDMSKTDAQKEAELLGVKYRSIGIEPIYEAFVESLSEAFEDTQADKTEENIQARSRGVLLMALSNKLGYLVLTTGNKSEMAVGYATLYGDMAGGLDVLKDVPKTLVFKLANYRNTLSYVIPERVISRPPSAELAPDQKDEDSLPAYDILDQILELYIEQDFSFDGIVARGFDTDQVRQVVRMVDLNEYKRRQSPIGIRISRKAFGRDRRYPITNGWHIGE
ncbi:MAG: NAD+ synthase (glutamine-hydrolyzing) [Lentisphaeria bacterium]|jgi:NAD+ synthase (glutamine-hydrolysing)